MRHDSDSGETERPVPGATRRAVPIACSLSADEARDRIARWQHLVLNAKLGARTEGGLVEAIFRNEGTVRTELLDLVAAERTCCPFLDFEVSETDALLALRIAPVNEDARADLVALAPALGLV